MRRIVALILLVLLPASGCYSYVAQRPASIPPGSEVRVHLSQEGVERIGAAYGSASGVLEGELERWGEEIVVTVPVPAAPGMLDRGLRNRIVVRQADVVGVDLKQRDQTRSIALGASLGLLTAAVAIGMFGGVFGGGTNVEEPPPEDVRIPLSF